MASPFVPSNFMYGDLPQGGQLAPIVVAARNPSNTVDKQYAAGYFWLSSLDMYQIVGGVPVYGSGNLYYQAGNSSGSPNWVLVSDLAGPVEQVLGTTNQITATTVAGTVTLSIPATFIAPGSIASTTTVTGGTGLIATTGGVTASAGNIVATLGNITASAGNIAATAGSVSAGTTITAGTGITSTTGNIVATAGAVSAGTTVTGGTGVVATTGNVTASAGNLVSVGAGNGVSLPVTTGSGAASGTVNCNGRVGSVTFTGVSVAQNADITLTMGNTSITGASTRCVWSLSGATTNSALTVKSYTPSASQVVWVVTNGGTATSTANITFDFIVLN